MLLQNHKQVLMYLFSRIKKHPGDGVVHSPSDKISVGTTLTVEDVCRVEVDRAVDVVVEVVALHAGRVSMQEQAVRVIDCSRERSCDRIDWRLALAAFVVVVEVLVVLVLEVVA